MDPYMDYTYYTETYHGSGVSETQFPNYALQASALLNTMTFGRSDIVMNDETSSDEIKDKIKMATCSVMDQYFKLETNPLVVQSEKVGSYAVTYFEKLGASDQMKYLRSAMAFLSDTGLLYRGF